MGKIGIFFGTESGTTRLIAKKIAKKIKTHLGNDAVEKPININRVNPEDLLAFDALILGTPNYAEGALPGKASNTKDASWLEFLPQIARCDFSDKKIALFGLGDQEEYPESFLDGMRDLHDAFIATGAALIGSSSIEGFQYRQSRAVENDHFIGLALDHHLQHRLTDARIDKWLENLLPQLDLQAGQIASKG